MSNLYKYLYGRKVFWNPPGGSFLIEGKLYLDEDFKKIYICQNELCGSPAPYTFGYKYSYLYLIPNQNITKRKLYEICFIKDKVKSFEI
jgi:hypothetical protein